MAVVFTIIFAVEAVWLYFFGDDARLERPFALAFLAAVSAIWLAQYVLGFFTDQPAGYVLVLGIAIFFIMPTIYNMEK